MTMTMTFFKFIFAFNDKIFIIIAFLFFPGLGFRFIVRHKNREVYGFVEALLFDLVSLALPLAALSHFAKPV